MMQKTTQWGTVIAIMVLVSPVRAAQSDSSAMRNPNSITRKELWTINTRSDGGSRSDSQRGSVSDMANAIGNNDALQQLTGDLATSAKVGAQYLSQDAWQRHFHNGATLQYTEKTLDNATRIYGYSAVLEGTAKLAPHVGWAATSAGRATEGDYSGAAIQGVNGVARTLVVAKIGGLAGLWAGAKTGAAVGSVGGPLGMGAGFVVGAGAAWIVGAGWDNTISVGVNAMDQRVADWRVRNQYAGDGKSKTSIPRSDDPAISAWLKNGEDPPSDVPKSVQLNFDIITVQAVTAVGKDTGPMPGGPGEYQTTFALRFWNVGSMVEGHGEARMEIISTFSGVKGHENTVEKDLWTGTFSGGPVGKFVLNNDDGTVSGYMSNGRIVRLSDMRLTVENPGAFANWP